MAPPILDNLRMNILYSADGGGGTTADVPGHDQALQQLETFLLKNETVSAENVSQLLYALRDVLVSDTDVMPQVSSMAGVPVFALTQEALSRYGMPMTAITAVYDPKSLAIESYRIPLVDRLRVDENAEMICVLAAHWAALRLSDPGEQSVPQMLTQMLTPSSIDGIVNARHLWYERSKKAKAEHVGRTEMLQEIESISLAVSEHLLWNPLSYFNTKEELNWDDASDLVVQFFSQDFVEPHNDDARYYFDEALEKMYLGIQSILKKHEYPMDLVDKILACRVLPDLRNGGNAAMQALKILEKFKSGKGKDVFQTLRESQHLPQLVDAISTASLTLMEKWNAVDLLVEMQNFPLGRQPAMDSAITYLFCSDAETPSSHLNSLDEGNLSMAFSQRTVNQLLQPESSQGYIEDRMKLLTYVASLGPTGMMRSAFAANLISKFFYVNEKNNQTVIPETQSIWFQWLLQQSDEYFKFPSMYVFPLGLPDGIVLHEDKTTFVERFTHAIFSRCEVFAKHETGHDRDVSVIQDRDDYYALRLLLRSPIIPDEIKQHVRHTIIEPLTTELALLDVVKGDNILFGTYVDRAHEFLDDLRTL